MSKFSKWLLFIAVVAIACGIAWWNVVSFVSGEGVIQPAVMHQVKLPIDGKIADIYVSEGMHVRCGTRILRISDSYELSKLSSEYALANNALHETKVELGISRDLFKQGIINEMQFRMVENRKDNAARNFNSICARYSILSQNADFDPSVCAPDTLDICSPSEGVVLFGNIGKFDNISPGQHLFSIAQLDSMEVIAFVRERDVYRLKIGQSVRVKGPGTSQMRIPGILKEFQFQAKAVEAKTLDRTSVARVIVALDRADPRIITGGPVRCSIRVR